MSTDFWRNVHDYKDGHHVEWLRVGHAFFDHLHNLIREAKVSIHFQIYLIDSDETGTALLDELIAAANRGVDVNLVVDGFGAGALKKEDEVRLTISRIHFKRFEPYVSSGKFYVGRRMHHKILVIDEKLAMVGGMNVADRYRGVPPIPPWLDYAVIVQGPVCKELAASCRKILTRTFVPKTPKWPQIFTKFRTLDPTAVWVRVRKNDWLRNRREITQSYNKAVRLSKKSVTIVGGYFLPGRRFRNVLAKAVERGVDVKIIMTRESDVKTVKYASDYLYGWMLKNGIRVFESKDAMVHGKVAIVDDTWTTVGSYNQNHLSAYFSIELNLDIVNNEFSKSFNQHLLKVIETECVEVTEEYYFRSSTWHIKLRRWVSYQLVRFSLRMMLAVNRIFVFND